MGGEPDTFNHNHAICGIVAERKGAPVPEGNLATGITTPTGALMYFGKITEKCEKDSGFDRYRFEALPQAGFDMPSSYGGTSGAGLWRLYVNPVQQGFDVVQHRLVGVAYYQTGNDEILCQGQMSIYSLLYDRAKKKWLGEWD